MIGLAQMMMRNCGYVLWEAPPKRAHARKDHQCQSCKRYFAQVDACLLRMRAVNGEAGNG